jgi:hypothetical protein
MNFDCRKVSGVITRAKARCWLTLSDELFEEIADTRIAYPMHAGTN